MYNVAIDILNILNKNGYDAYIVGGYPRDLLLKINSSDIDICTSATPDIIKNLFIVIEDNSRFGSLKIKKDNFMFEITTFRIDVEYKGRYPEIKYTDSIKQDLMRRDFTINTICINYKGDIIDELNAIDDINNKVIRCVGNTCVKIKEDPLRILRAIRFCGKLNFKLDIELETEIKKNSYLLKDISENKKKEEINKMNEKAINMLKEFNIEVIK